MKFKCQNGYTLVGMSTIICMPSGFWSASIPLCLPKVITQCKCTCDNPAGAQDLLKNTGSSFACITESKAIVNLNDSEYVVLKTDN